MKSAEFLRCYALLINGQAPRDESIDVVADIVDDICSRMDSLPTVCQIDPDLAGVTREANNDD